MVHNAGWWCTMQIDGAQRSSHKSGQADRQVQSDAYMSTMQVAQVGSKIT